MFYLVKAAVPHMKPGSSIVNTASINAKMPVPEQLAYSSTKAAITNFMPMKRPGQPVEVAPPYVMLASTKAATSRAP